MAQTTIKCPGDIFFSVKRHELNMILYLSDSSIYVYEIDLSNCTHYYTNIYSVSWFRENFTRL